MLEVFVYEWETDKLVYDFEFEPIYDDPCGWSEEAWDEIDYELTNEFSDIPKDISGKTHYIQVYEKEDEEY